MINSFAPVNIVPTNNRVYRKNCTATLNRPGDKAFQPDEIKLIREHLWERVHSRKYDVNGYAILFSSHTGVRQGEIPSLRWDDIGDNKIHIHSQQNDKKVDGKKVYYYEPTTKNEKGVSNDGRYLPLTDEVNRILTELKQKQDLLGIKSEWVFCKEDGSWTTTASYSEALYRLCKGDKARGTDGLGLELCNNHAFRIALNSYVFIPMGLDAPERAKLLGHSVETNLKHYTFARTDEYLSEIKERWNEFNNATDEDKNPEPPQGVNQGSTKIVEFRAKKETPSALEN